MKTFLAALEERPDITELRKALKKGPGLYELSGCIDNAKSHIIYTTGIEAPARLIVTESESRARELLEEYRFFDPSAMYFPAKDLRRYSPRLTRCSIVCRIRRCLRTGLYI